MSFPRPGVWSSHATDRLASIRELKNTISNLPVPASNQRDADARVLAHSWPKGIDAEATSRTNHGAPDRQTFSQAA